MGRRHPHLVTQTSVVYHNLDFLYISYAIVLPPPPHSSLQCALRHMNREDPKPMRRRTDLESLLPTLTPASCGSHSTNAFALIFPNYRSDDCRVLSSLAKPPQVGRHRLIVPRKRWLRTKLLFSVLVVAGVPSGCRESAEVVENIGQKAARAQTFDAGVVTQGEVVSHAFVVENRHPFALRIADRKRDIQKNCGCALAVVERDRLAPEESTFVTMEVDTAGRQGTQNSQARLVWTSEAGVQFDTVLELRMKVLPELQIAPAAIAFDETDVRLGRRQEVVITSISRIVPAAFSTKSTSPDFDVSKPEISGSQAKVYVRYVGSNQTKRLDGRLFVTVRAEASQPSREVRVSAPLVFQPDPKRSISVHPEHPVISVDENGRANGRLLLQGDVAADSLISVTHNGRSLEYKVKNQWEGCVLVDFIVAFLEGEHTGERVTELAIVLEGRGELRVPVEFFWARQTPHSTR